MAQAEVTDTRVQGRPRSSATQDELLTLREVADLLDVSPNTIYYWRYQRTGPRGHKVGRQIRYWKSDVLDWLRDRADRVAGLPSIRKP